MKWLLLGVCLLAAAILFWQFGNHRAASNTASSAPPSNNPSQPQKTGASTLAGQSPSVPFQLLSQPGAVRAKQAGVAAQKRADRLKYRLSNSSQTAGQLARNGKAILLENALIDTAKPFSLSIPTSLGAQGDPGTYIVQAGGPLDAAFRARLKEVGATIVAYIPNNAYLVRASQAIADELATDPGTTVLAYQPYYKLKPSLLALTMEDKPLPDNSVLNVLLFQDARDATVAALQQMGAQVLSEEPSPFGPILKVRPGNPNAIPQSLSTPPPSLNEVISALARLPGVQEMEMARTRVPANDLSRATVGVAASPQATTNYLGLIGSNVFVNINDTGVDTNHPDLQGRVMFDVPISGVDSNGHGTHVAGTIAGSGLESLSVKTNAEGSPIPATNFQFRGMAPAAQLFSMLADPLFGPNISDTYLQQTAAQTNALLGGGPFISNNSWNYGGDNEYDLAAASYDAAVRDALPQMTGSQPILYVFAAGNADYAIDIWDDGSADDGQSGSPDTIISPATAKNVITVGAIEQPRNITNNVVICTTVLATNGVTNASTTCVTNQEWLPSTDSSDQVAGFSGMGNVGVGIEGDAGRYKPDVVAPGTMVISTRSTQWNQANYYNPTSYIFQSFIGLVVNSNSFADNTVFVPDNAVSLTVEAFSSLPLKIYVNQAAAPTNATSGFVASGTNIVMLPPAAPLNPTGVDWWWGVADPTNTPLTFDLFTTIAVTNQYGDFLEVLSNLNNTIGPFYRYESGTSMAAADVSGTLALMEEFFEQRLHLTNSPALMKALLINGARPLDLYDFNARTPINYQGWGLINLPNSLGTLTNLTASPATPASMFIFDQNPTNALATGQSRTRFIKMSDVAAQGQPLRVTLVWTDPPGNPVASLKLVNNLDLVVTNMDTGDVFFGNDITAGNDFNLPWDTNNPPNLDVVNNVQNVYIGPTLGSNYSVTVLGNRVNVNAVTMQTNDVVQDYALVISAGEGQVPDSFTLTDTPVSPVVTTPLVSTIVSNSFAGDNHDVGGILSNERVGGNTPLWGTNTIPLTPGSTNAQITIGMTNQWHFYAVTNSGGSDFTNAAFLTFLARDLSIPRTGVYQEGNPANATRVEPDIDLYVTTDPSLTNLNPTAVANATKSLSRGSEEIIVFSNAVPGTVYYAGVKSEDQEAAQYSFLADFSNIPFGSSDQQGNQYLRGFPAPAPIPSGTPQDPGIATVIAPGVQPITVHRVVVTNNITASLMGGLLGALSLNGNISVVLNNHAPSFGVTNQTFIYDDSGENNITGSRHTDGPGTLTRFGGRDGAGEWMLTESDNDPTHSGTNNYLYIFLEKQQPLTSGLTLTLGPGGCDTEYLDVPQAATNLIIAANILSGTGPVSVQVCPLNGGGCQDIQISGPGTNSIVINKSSNPPLNPGTYGVTLCNLGTGPVTVFLIAYINLDLNPIIPTVFTATGPTPLLDDAVSYSSINVNSNQNIVSTEVGVRIDHPRVSDLVLTLISPSGTRVLLCENRGGDTPSGMGTDILTTNAIPVNASGGQAPQTNTFNTGMASGTIQISYDMYQLPDSMNVYYGLPLTNNLIWATPGLVSGAATTNLSYPPAGYTGPPTTVITIVMNQFGNPDPSTQWTYTITSTEAQFNYLTFTENTNITTIPIKFAVPPFTNSVANTVNGVSIFSDGFDTGAPGYYNSIGSSFSGGWVLQGGDVSVLTNGYQGGLVCDSGSQCLQLDGTNYATISTNVTLVPGNNYLLSFAYASDPDNAGTAPQAVVYVDGINQWLVTGSPSNTWANVGWQTVSFQFTASATNQELSLQALTQGPGMLFDTFNIQLQTVQTGLFYLPEESLDKLAGENALGNWQLEVMDNRAGPSGGTNTATLLSWELSFIFDTPLPEPIPVNPITDYTNSVPPGQIDYFIVYVPPWALDATNWLVSATGPVNLLFNQNIEPTGSNVAGGDFTLLANMTTGVATLITNNLITTVPPLVPGASYYLGVQNTSATNINFVLQVDFNITALTNAIPVTSTLQVGPLQRYFSFNVDTNATAVTFQLLNLSGDVDLVASKVPFPDLENYAYASTNPGTNNEEIIVFTNSLPVPLTPGEWYLGVFNQDTQNVTYTILATEYTNAFPNIITLQNGIPYANSNSDVAPATDYYLFVVTPDAVRAQFEIDNPSAQVDLLVHEGLPLPTFGNSDYTSANTGTNGQLLVVFNNSGPVPLGPGNWYLSAVDVAGVPVTYTIKATEWPFYGTNIVITNEYLQSNSFCITWTSVAGFDYFVEGNTSINTTNWVVDSPTIQATGPLTTYCIPLPSPFSFFRVVEGLGAAPATLSPINITSITRATNGIVLRWTAPTNSQFEVQWTASIRPPSWNTFNGIVTSTNTSYSYTDDGTQSGGLGGLKYYRLLQLP